MFDAIVPLAFLAVLSVILVGPIGRAFADRLRHKGVEPAADMAELDAMRDELHGMRQQLSDLAERQDFTERLLAQARERGQLSQPKDAK